MLNKILKSGHTWMLLHTLIASVLIGAWAIYPRELSESIRTQDVELYIKEGSTFQYVSGSHITYVNPDFERVTNLGALLLLLGFIVMLILACRSGKNRKKVGVICAWFFFPYMGLAFLISLVNPFPATVILDEYRDESGSAFVMAYQGFLQADSVYMLSTPEKGRFYHRYPKWGHSVGPYESKTWIPIVRPATVNKQQCLYPISGNRLLGVFGNRAFMLIDMNETRMLHDAELELGPFVLLDVDDELMPGDLDELNVWLDKLAGDKSYNEIVYQGKIDISAIVRNALDHPNKDLNQWAQQYLHLISDTTTQPASGS